MQDVETPQNLTVAGYEQVEVEARQALRELLGANAEGMFAVAEEAYQAIFMQAQQEIQGQGQSGRPAGLAQLGTSGIALGMLFAFPDSVANKDQPVEVKRTEKMNEFATAEFNLNFSRSGSKITGDVSVKVTISIDSKSLVETTKGKMEMEACPDAQGNVTVKIDLNMDIIGSAEGQTGGGQLSLAGTATGHVNDDAALTGMEMDVTGSKSN